MVASRTEDEEISVFGDNEDDVRKKQKAKDCCKKVVKFLFSHIGLCVMVVLYSVAGGFMFKYLEETNEQMECEKAFEKYGPAENDTIGKMREISAAYGNDDDKEQALKQFLTVLQNYRTIVLDLGYDGRNCSMYGKPGGPTYSWNLAGSILFAVTIITTVGYGNISPKTFWGRLVCIAYAILGIPLMVMCLANIGDLLADLFRIVYTKVCCCGCFRRKKNNKVKPCNEKESSVDAWKKEYEQQKNANKTDPVIDDDDEDENDEHKDQISVPIIITLALLGLYIFIGALIFGVWEGWNPLDASYFCFVTISTIGFGDMVPGATSLENPEFTWKMYFQMMFTAVYSLFGMALLSMCFNLIQEELATKFTWIVEIGEKLGCGGNKKEDDDEAEERITDDKQNKTDNTKNVKDIDEDTDGEDASNTTDKTKTPEYIEEHTVADYISSNSDTDTETEIENINPPKNKVD